MEASPLSRVLKQAAPGAAWKMGSGHEIEFGTKREERKTREINEERERERRQLVRGREP